MTVPAVREIILLNPLFLDYKKFAWNKTLLEAVLNITALIEHAAEDSHAMLVTCASRIGSSLREEHRCHETGGECAFPPRSKCLLPG